MPENPKTADRMLAVLVVVATVVTAGVNVVAALGLINGVTPATISDRHPSLLTPAGYAFSIWSLIYVGLLGFAVYQLVRAQGGKLGRVRLLYIASCVLNCAWIWSWHYGYVGVCLGVIIALAVILVLIVEQIAAPASFVDSLLTKAPFGIYAGWVTSAAFVNLNIVVSQYAGEPVVTITAVASIIAATAVAVAVCLRMNNYFFPLAVAWALAAIAIKQTGHTTIIIAAAFGCIICLLMSGTVVTKLKDSTSE
jgi:benzodiazapine receptor